MTVHRLRDAALPILTALIYLNLSAVLVRYHGFPSILRLTVAALFLLAVLELRGTGILEALTQPLTFLLASYLTILLLTTTFARNVRLADERAADVAKSFGLYLLVVALASNWSRIRHSTYAVIGSAVLLSLLGVYQSLSGNYERWFGGLARVKKAHLYGDVFQQRIAGPLGDPNFFALILLIAVPLALFVGWEFRRLAVRWIAFGGAALIMAAILLTYSRGGMLALGVVILLALVAHRVDRRRLIGTAVALILGLLLLPPSFSRRFITIGQILPGGEESLHSDSSFQKRKLLTAAAFETFKDHPLLGVGGGNYTVWFDEYAERVGSEAREYDDPGERHYPHSLYLEIAAETGLLGFVIFAAIIVISWLSLHAAARELAGRRDREAAAIARAFELALVGYLVASLFLHGHFQRYLWLLFGFASAISRLTAEPTAEEDLPETVAETS